MKNVNLEEISKIVREDTAIRMKERNEYVSNRFYGGKMSAEEPIKESNDVSTFKGKTIKDIVVSDGTIDLTMTDGTVLSIYGGDSLTVD